MNEKIKAKKNALISLAVLLVTVVVNFSSAAGLINATSQSEVSKSYPTMITPAGYAFSIWGVIYIVLFISFLLPVIKSNSEFQQKSINTVASLFWISSVFNVIWTFAFSYKIIWLSAILIVAIYVTLFILLMKLKSVNNNNMGIMDVGFGLYAGWLSIASVVNFCAFLVSVNFNFFNAETLFYTVILVVFIAVALILIKFHQNPILNLSAAWAFYAIIVKRAFENYTDIMFIVLAIGIVLLVVASALTFRKKKFMV